MKQRATNPGIYIVLTLTLLAAGLLVIGLITWTPSHGIYR